jgi:hypothetical protein
MEPFIRWGVATHSPGDIVARQMADMGWGILKLPPSNNFIVRPMWYSIEQNSPNPFNSTTIIEYQIEKDEFVKINVYDITGRFVKELVNCYRTAGIYKVEFNASNIASGVYYYRLEADDYKHIQKMMLIK